MRRRPLCANMSETTASWFITVEGEGGDGREVPPFSVPGVMRVWVGLRVKALNLGCAAAGAEAQPERKPRHTRPRTPIEQPFFCKFC